MFCFCLKGIFFYEQRYFPFFLIATDIKHRRNQIFLRFLFDPPILDLPACGPFQEYRNDLKKKSGRAQLEEENCIFGRTDICLKFLSCINKLIIIIKQKNECYVTGKFRTDDDDDDVPLQRKETRRAAGERNNPYK